MSESGFTATLKLGNDAVGQYLPQFNATLIERIDIPDGALNEKLVLVERDQLAQCLRRQAIREHSVCWAVALEGAVRHLKCWDTPCRDFFSSLAERQGFGLGEEVRHQEIVMRAQWVHGLAEADEVARDQLGSLMDELVECVLPVGSRLPPDDRSGLIVHRPALQIDMLAIALHIELLQVGRQAPEIMVIGQDRHSLSAEKVVISDADQSQEYRQVALKGSRAEMFIHRVEAASISRNRSGPIAIIRESPIAESYE